MNSRIQILLLVSLAGIHWNSLAQISDYGGAPGHVMFSHHHSELLTLILPRFPGHFVSVG